jgi:phosphoribosylformylglycinamidine synthase
VGELVEGGRLHGRWQGQTLLDLPIQPLMAGVPEPDPTCRRPGHLDVLSEAPLPEDLRPAEVERSLRRLLQSPIVASKREVFQQFDGTVGGNTLLGMGRGDAGLLRVEDEAGRDTGQALAMAAAGSHRASRLDPFWGAAHAAAEACRDLACVGAEPIGFAVCLDEGDPRDPESRWTLEQSCLGLRQACLGLDVPILSEGPVEGTGAQGPGSGPVLAALGWVGDCAGPVAVDSPDVTALSKVGNRIGGMGFRAVHDGIFLLGETREELGASEYLRVRTGRVEGACPELRLDEELRLGACVREGIRLGLIRSAHGTRAGGLLVAVLESAFGAREGQGMGCQILLHRGALRLDSLLFGESAGRIVVSVAPEGEGSLATLCDTHRVPFAKIGSTGGARITLAVDGKPLLDADAAELRSLHAEALAHQMPMTV